MTFMSDLDALMRAVTSSVPSAERFQMSAVSSIVLLCSGELAFELLQKLSLLYATVVLPASACLVEMQPDLAAEPGEPYHKASACLTWVHISGAVAGDLTR